MDHNFTQKIKEWLETPAEERDYKAGALYLLKLSGNRIMYKNLIGQIDRQHQFVEYQLQKYYNFRVAALTHAEVTQMEAEVEKIVEEHIPLAAKADSETLPDDIKAKYVEYLSLMQLMRDLHMKLRSLSLENATCPDSERYPFLKELISLDKKLHANWEAYDRYVPAAEKVATRKKSAKK